MMTASAASDLQGLTPLILGGLFFVLAVLYRPQHTKLLPRLRGFSAQRGQTSIAATLDDAPELEDGSSEGRDQPRLADAEAKHQADTAEDGLTDGRPQDIAAGPVSAEDKA